jgi:hypothetical protein
MKTIHLKRSAALVGLAVAAMGAVQIVPGVASAQVPNPVVGQFAGGLTFTPASGNGGETPTFTAAHACPTGTANATVVVIDLGKNEQGYSNPVDSVTASTPGWGGPLLFTMSLAPIIAGTGTLPESFEFVVDCHVTAGVPGTLTDYAIVNYAADGSWNMGTSTGPVQTTTSVTGPSTVQVGGNVTLNATVAPANAAGTVQFKDNGVNLGSPVAVASGAAQFSTTTLAAGAHPITAQFVPTSATAFGGSTSPVFTVTVSSTSGNTQTETINVNVPSSEGAFVMTVSSTPVQMSAAVLSADSTTFTSTGTLGAVTVSDGRNQSAPGWRISGQVSDFANGTKTIDGNSLGWTPTITTANAANDVTAGPAVAAGANPGLKQGSGLASAAAAKGVGSTVIGANLALTAPATTAAGTYSATLTITAVASA